MSLSNPHSHGNGPAQYQKHFGHSGEFADFSRVLASDDEPPDLRYMAARELGRIDSAASRRTLIENSHTADREILTGIMMALARIGDLATLDVIQQVRSRATGTAAVQAQFAAAVISYRFGIEGNDLPGPEGLYLRLADADLVPATIAKPSSKEADICHLSLSTHPFGFGVIKENMHHIRCSTSEWMLVLNEEFGSQGNLELLLKRKAFVALVAGKSQSSGSYSPSFLLLTSPAAEKGDINILIPRATGELWFSGTARIASGKLQYRIDRSVSRPGGYGIEIEGTFQDGHLVVERFRSSRLVQKRTAPTLDPIAPHQALE